MADKWSKLEENCYDLRVKGEGPFHDGRLIFQYLEHPEGLFKKIRLLFIYDEGDHGEKVEFEERHELYFVSEPKVLNGLEEKFKLKRTGKIGPPIHIIYHQGKFLAIPGLNEEQKILLKETLKEIKRV